MSVKTLAARLQYAGGDQLGRINKQKLRSLQSALKNDYNSRMIKTPLKSAWPCLINKNNLKPDYDKKIISVEFNSGLEAGDVFEILDDQTHWMVYLPILTETAYLRAEIIRCRYQLEIDNEMFWIYFQGPTETDLRWFIKQGTNFNELNLSGTIYIKNTPKTKEFFKRFTHLKIDGHTWEVQVTDSITVPGIIELEIQEYFDNPIEELPEVIKENCISQIVGQTIVKQDKDYGYEIQSDLFNEKYSWSVDGNDRVKIKDIYRDGRLCKVHVYEGAIGSFRVYYGDKNSGYHLDAEIDIKEPYIKGAQQVYPYDTHEYQVNDEGHFWVETKLAQIIEEEENKCSVEIKTGKTGKFVLYFKSSKNNEQYELPITIQSF